MQHPFQLLPKTLHHLFPPSLSFNYQDTMKFTAFLEEEKFEDQVTNSGIKYIIIIDHSLNPTDLLIISDLINTLISIKFKFLTHLDTYGVKTTFSSFCHDQTDFKQQVNRLISKLNKEYGTSVKVLIVSSNTSFSDIITSICNNYGISSTDKKDIILKINEKVKKNPIFLNVKAKPFVPMVQTPSPEPIERIAEISPPIYKVPLILPVYQITHPVITLLPPPRQRKGK